jgi:hypothetical protein
MSDGYCDECGSDPEITLQLIEELMAGKSALTAQLSTAREFIEARGHKETCLRRHHCAICDKPHWALCHQKEEWNLFKHEFTTGRCTCGYREAMGETK